MKALDVAKYIIAKSDNVGDLITNKKIKMPSDAFSYCGLQYNYYDNGYYLGNDNNPYVIFMTVSDSSLNSYNIHLLYRNPA